MAILVSGVAVELREVILRDKPEEMLEASPKGTVPVLAIPDGRVLDESLNIMRWALGQNDPENWLLRNDEELIAANDGSFKHALDRYKYPHRYHLPDGLEHRDAALKDLVALNDRLARTPYLDGERRGFTDIALFPFVRQFAATDHDWFDTLPLLALQNWLDGLIHSKLFASIMTRYPQWKLGNAPTPF